MLNYALRVNLTIAIVAMVVDPRDSHSTHAIISNITDLNMSSAASLISSAVGNITEMAVPDLSNATMTAVLNAEDAGKFHWDSFEQNIILGSFFWGYILTELPGGRLAELIGGHRVFGHSMLWASVLTLFTPFAAMFDYKAVVFLRALLGLLLGEFIFSSVSLLIYFY